MRKDSPNTGLHLGAPGISSLLDLRRFERRSRRLLGAGYVFAAVMLAILALTWHAPPRVASIAEKPDYILLGDIIERPAIPTDEPFRMNPPNFARRTGRPGVSAPEASAPVPGSPSLPAWKESSPSFEREIGREVDRLSRGYTDTLNVDGGIPRGPKVRIPFRRETGPDPGLFKADIIYNPANKTAAQGFVHIPLFQGEKIEKSDRYNFSLRGLVAGINRRTNIIAKLDLPRTVLQTESRSVSTSELSQRSPRVLYILADRSHPITENDRIELTAFMANNDSCVLFLDNGEPGNEIFRDSLRSSLQFIAGDIYAIEPIPRNHFLFHCFYDFKNGPPEGAGQEFGAIPHKVQPYLEGIWRNGRLAAIFSDRGYGLCWGAEGKYEEQMKMGVNLVLYSIIQQKEKPGHRSVAHE